MAFCLLALPHLSAQVLYFEDFSGQNGLMPTNMNVYNADANTPAILSLAAYTQWIVTPSTENTGDTVAAVTSWLVTPSGQPGTANDWLVTPQITGLTATASLTWTAVSRDIEYPDGYAVYVSTTGNSIANFLANPPVFSTAAEEPFTTFRGVDLSAYAGQSIYVAFRANSTDRFILEIDDILVANELDCELGSIAGPSLVPVCSGESYMVELEGDNSLLDISTSGYGIIFQPTATGGGGIGDTLTLFGISFPYELDADLGGILSANSLPAFTGTYTLAVFAYLNDADLGGSFCSEALNSIAVEFNSSPNCGATCLSGPVTLSSQAQVDAFPSNNPGCTRILGNLTINGGANITNLDGLLQVTAIEGILNINGNTALTSLEGLSNLTELQGYLAISGNTQLTDLAGLEGLSSIGGYLRIQNNANLADLGALSGLTEIDGYLRIQNNAALTSLEGLGGIDPASISDLILQSSANLSLCELPNICAYLGDPSNTATITGNAANCASVAAVQAACFSCEPPAGAPLIVPQSPSSVYVDWADADGAQTYPFLWRQIGPGVPFVRVNVQKSAYTLTGLNPGANHAIRLRSKCGPTPADMSDLSPTYTFMTPTGSGSCGTPSIALVDSIAANRVRVYWAYVPGATEYRLQFRPTGTIVWSSRTSTEANVFINGITPDIEYEYRVNATCPAGITDYSAIFTYTLNGSGSARPLAQVLAEPADADGLSLYPNPTSGLLYVEFGAAAYAQVQIYNAAGQRLWVMDLEKTGERSEIALGALPDGLYLLQFLGEGGASAVRRVLVQR